jgi:hypothetical protein
VTISRLPLAAFFASAICGPPQPSTAVTAEELHDCAGKKLAPYDGPDGVRLAVRVTDKTSVLFTPVNICLRVDGGLIVAQPQSTVDPRRGIDYAASVPPGKHVVMLVIRAAGMGRGYGHQFEIKSAHETQASTETSLEATLYEVGGPDTPIERRPAIRWTGEKESAPVDGGVEAATENAIDAGLDGPAEDALATP